jgi:hypothetical protein
MNRAGCEALKALAVTEEATLSIFFEEDFLSEGEPVR